MSKAWSVDLRASVLAAVASGASTREAARRFGVSRASVRRWYEQQRERGDLAPRKAGGDRRSHRVEAHREAILAALGSGRDRTIEEVRRALHEQGLDFGFGTLQRFFKRHCVELRRKARRAGRIRPDGGSAATA